MATASATVTDLSPRLVLTFRQAGLLSAADVKKYEEKYGKQKSIVAVMKQDVSLETFREFFGHEFHLPFAGPKRKPILGHELNQGLNLHREEIAELLVRHRPPLERLVAALERTDAVEKGVLSAAVAEAAQVKEDPYEWLVRHEHVTSERLTAFLGDKRNGLAAECAMFLALAILHHNGLIEADAFDAVIARAAGIQDGNAAAEMRKAVRLTGVELLEKIESGLYLQDVSLDRTVTDDSLYELFPEGLIRRQTFVPIFADEHRIGLAMADPLNVNLGVLIRLLTGKWMQPCFCPAGVIIDRINEVLGGETKPEAKPEARVPPAAPEPKTAPPDAPPTKSKAKAAKGEKKPRKKEGAKAPKPVLLRPGEAPVDSLSAVQLVSSLIENAIDLRATDIHLEPTRTEMTVRFRIDGRLNKILSLPQNLVGPVTSRLKVLSNMDVTERRRPQDGHIMLDINDRHFDFRLATMPTVFGEKVAIRILDSSRVMTGLAQLGLNKKQLSVTDRLIHLPYGIVIVSGPTGSGKTSTLYAALHELNDEQHHLVTIEDPVEYQLNGINQVQVDPNVGLTFSEGLRATLRQDPDIIMVGEIRDGDTAKTAIRAAMTGHLVFSTLHTNTALGAFQALANLGATPYLIGSAVAGVIAQRLVRRLCAKCARSRPLTKALAQQLGLEYSSRLRMKRPVGCAKCLESGYTGRIGVFEVIETTEELRQAVLNNESPNRLLEIANSDGRISINEAGLEKARAGITSPEELVEKILLDT